ncbi:MAG TPA: ArsA-related P-loop ATPase [Armatimonadota bacterium]
MKIAVTGKGGVGKTTLAAALARLYAASGCEVLAVDADPDSNLADALGMPAELRSGLRPLSRNKEFIEERTGATPGQYGQVFSLNPHVSDVAELFAVRHRGVSLLVLGAIQTAGGGCACPENVLLAALLRHLVLRTREVVVLDMEAGIEHLGRGTVAGVDLAVAVVEPGRRSLETAERIQTMAADLRMRGFGVVLNKARHPEEAEEVRARFGESALLGVVPYDERLIEADRLGQCVADLEGGGLMAPYRAIWERLVQRHGGPVERTEGMPGR